MPEDQRRVEDDQPVERAGETPALRDAIATFTGLTGVFVAFLWLAGRTFVSGYFRAMGIPRYLVVFSIWEYAEASWFWAIAFALLFVFLEGLLLALFRYLGSLVNRIRRSRAKQIEGAGEQPEAGRPAEELGIPRIYFTISRAALLLTASLVLLVAVLLQVGERGEERGRQVVLGPPVTEIALVASTPLALPAPSVFTATVSGAVEEIYVYEGLALLTHNDGRYYVYDAVDSETCRPVQVYVVADASLVQVTLFTNPSKRFACPP